MHTSVTATNAFQFDDVIVAETHEAWNSPIYLQNGLSKVVSRMVGGHEAGV